MYILYLLSVFTLFSLGSWLVLRETGAKEAKVGVLIMWAIIVVLWPAYLIVLILLLPLYFMDKRMKRLILKIKK